MSEPAPVTPRLLRRSSQDRMIAGVCGGLGRYLGVDPVVLRVAFVILVVAGGSGLLIYVVAWILIPSESPGDHLGHAPSSASGTGQVLVGTALIALGTLLLIDRFVPWFHKVVGPLVLVGLGVAVLLWGTRR